MNLQADAAGLHLLDERRRLVRIAAAEETEIDRPVLGGLQHLADIERAAGIDADGDRAERAAEHRGDARRDGVLAQPGRVEMDMHVDGARRGDHAFAIAHRGGGRNDQPRIDAVHDGRVAGLAEADDAAVLDAEIAFDDADDRIDHQDVAEEKIERALRAGHAGGKPDAVAQRLAAAVQAFVAVDGVILLDDGDQRRVGQTDAVADRRAIKSGVVPACDRDHGRTSRALEAGVARAPQRGVAHRLVGRAAIGQGIEAGQFAPAAETDERDLFASGPARSARPCRPECRGACRTQPRDRIPAPC